MDKWKADRARMRAESRAEGLAEGRAVGLAEGRAEGLSEGRAEALNDIMERLRQDPDADPASVLEQLLRDARNGHPEGHRNGAQ